MSIIFCRCANCNIHPTNLLDSVVVDLWEHDLLLETHIVVSAAIKTFTWQSTEVTNSWQSQRVQTVQECPHSVPTECHSNSDRKTFTNFKIRNRFLCLCDDGLLTSNCRN